MIIRSLISVIAVCGLIYLPLFLYTQFYTVFNRINTYGYKLSDYELIFEGLPVWRLRIPFETKIMELMHVNPVGVVAVLVGVGIFLIVIFFGDYLSKRFKSRYDRKSYSKLLTTHQRKRGLCRIEYTATEYFNVYGGKGKVTRHTLRCFLDLIFRPIVILQNKIADEYNWPRRRRWNLQKGRAVK